jgi:NMD protein affecting ribosome stability and mRNA decay
MSNRCPKCHKLTDSRNGGLCLDCYFEEKGWKVDLKKVENNVKTKSSSAQSR